MSATAAKGRLQVRILGCGSSGGVPRIGNDWGVCDPAENCTGTTTTCPTDLFAPSTTTCGTSVTQYQCSSTSTCGALAQSRTVLNHCQAGGVCTQDTGTSWTTLDTCDVNTEICISNAGSALCSLCDANWAPDDVCADASNLTVYTGSSTCLNNTCNPAGYTATNQACPFGCAGGACNPSGFPCNAGNSTAAPVNTPFTPTTGGCYSFTVPSGQLRMNYYNPTNANVTLEYMNCDAGNTVVGPITLTRGTWMPFTVALNCTLYIHIINNNPATYDLQVYYW